MKKLLVTFSLVSASVWYLFGNTGNTFEGNLTVTSDTNGTVSGRTVLAVKNDLVAIEPGNGHQMVLNVKTGDFFTVVNQGGQKMTAKMNVSVLSGLRELPAFLEPFSSYLGSRSDASEVKATDEKKTISGYLCTKYIVKDKETVTTVWATRDIPFSLTSLMDVLNITGSANPALKASLPLQGSVKYISTSKTAGFSVSVEKKSLDARLFELPDELPVLDMTPLIQQMLQNNDPAQVKKVLDGIIKTPASAK
ncbi:MAG TPA: DUF4412 domain-containing protein [Chitinophagales bacterium]|nr:DUF4412 domain-containing protein [Chitinophagales bacterium]